MTNPAEESEPDDLILSVVLTARVDPFDTEDEDDGYESWSATLLVDSSGHDDGEPDVTLGGANLIVGRRARWSGTWLERLDYESQELGNVAAALWGKKQRIDEHLFKRHAEDGDDCVIVASVYLEEKYRGRGLSKILVDTAVKRLSPEALIALHPMPMSKDQSPPMVKKLRRHWASAGFVPHKSGIFVRGPRTSRS